MGLVAAAVAAGLGFALVELDPDHGVGYGYGRCGEKYGVPELDCASVYHRNGRDNTYP